MEKSETHGGDAYFDSYCDLEVHKLMLEDRPRTESYKLAIERQAELIRGKVVMDVGAGTGILSLFCSGAGAAKVYAVEASAMADHLEAVVKANHMEHVIEVIRGRAEDITLPCKVDVIVSEWMGFYLLHESMLDSVILARDKHLNLETGHLLPSHADLYAAAIDASELRRDLTEFWTNDVYGYDLSPLARVAGSPAKPEVTLLKESQLLTKPQLIVSLDLLYTSLEEVQSVRSRHFCSIESKGEGKSGRNESTKVMWNAMALWFDVHFRASSTETVTLSTSPLAPSTHWKQSVVFVSDSKIEVEIDDIIGWDLCLCQNETNKRHYDITVELLDAASEEHPVPCQCQWAKCVLIQRLMECDQDDDLG